MNKIKEIFNKASQLGDPVKVWRQLKRNIDNSDWRMEEKRAILVFLDKFIGENAIIMNKKTIIEDKLLEEVGKSPDQAVKIFHEFKKAWTKVYRRK